MTWPAYVGAIVSALGLVWSMTTAWFDLRARVDRLEERNRYVHGEFTLPKGDR